MLRKYSSLFFSLILAGSLACTPETYEKPIPQERFFYRFVNLNSKVDPIDVRLNSTEGLNWLGIDLKFGDSKPSQGYSSILVDLAVIEGDTIQRDTSDYLFLDVLDHRSKEGLVENFDLGKELNESNVSNRQSWYFLNDLNSPRIAMVLDSYELPTGGKAAVRIINFNSFWSDRGIKFRLKNDTTNFYPVDFLVSSGFEYPKAETRTVYFEDNRTKMIIDSIENVPFQAGRVYDFYFAEKDNQPEVGYYILK